MWKYALDEMRSLNTNIYGPMSFIEYCEMYGIRSKATAPSISVDYIDSLNKVLRSENTMVLRLGCSETNRGTQFILVKDIDVRNFFVEDDAIFTETPFEFVPLFENLDQLKAFHLMPIISETGLVNYGLVSGLFHYALGLDTKYPVYAPVTGKTTYTFQVRPSSGTEEYTHNNGQIEIDCMLFGYRDGQKILILIEAKRGNLHRSLAKHKLVYPLLGLKKSPLLDCEVLPVYVKINEYKDRIQFDIAECKLEDNSVSGLKVVTTKRLYICNNLMITP